MDYFGLIRVAQELWYLDIGYLPFSLIAGKLSYFPGPGTFALETRDVLDGFGLIVYLISLKVDPS